jgi:hypothetical protein
LVRFRPFPVFLALFPVVVRLYPIS